MRADERDGGNTRDYCAVDRRVARLRGNAAAERRHNFDCHSQDMKKIPVTESKAAEQSKPEKSEEQPSSSNPTETQPSDDDADLQADLDRFRDLALLTQADFENYKKRSAREKEDAIKYANSSLLERLIAIVDNFE